MRVTANMSAETSVYNIQQSRKRLDVLQELITSNQNVNRPSDDPIATRLLLDIGDKMKAFDQYNANIIKAKSWMQFSDTALTGINNVMQQTKSLMNTMNSVSTDPSERQNVQNQLIELKKQVVDFANTQYGDQYIFGGSNNLVPPFDATGAYSGDGTERQIEIAANTTQTISITGDRLLQGVGVNPSYGNENIFTMFDNLIAGVGDSVTPGDPVRLAAGIQSLAPAARQVFNAVNINLSRMIRVDNMTKLNENNKNTLANIVGNIQNVDMVKLGVQLNTEKNAFEASLAATAKLSQLSLLDFM